MNVLVADDDQITRLLLTSALSKLGQTVHQAQNGAEAWEAWKRDQHSLIISDWVMPELDGLDLCRKVRAEPGSDLTYIILLTARTGKANYLDAMEAGVDDFVTKPFEKDQVIARVRAATRILDLHEKLRLANNDLEIRVQERTAELEKALHAKGEFLSRASHELRTPMNHILGFAQLLEMGQLTADQQSSLQHILRGGRRLLVLIDRILAVSGSGSNDLDFLSGQRTPEASGMLDRHCSIANG
jgi:DNA-binding response OmpR family regulator